MPMENDRFEQQFRFLLIVAGVDLAACVVVALLFGGQAALVFFAVTLALLFLYSLSFCARMLEEDVRSQSRIVARDMRYRQTLGLLPEGVVILGNNAVIEWMNAEAQRHFGIDEKAVGWPFTEAVPDDRLRHWLNAREFGEPMLRQPPGSDASYEISVVAPDLQHTLIVSHDVTAKRRIEDMRRDFVANVSHELRTPLTVIGGFFDLGEPLEKHHVDLIRDQVARMRHIVDDLLMLSGLENRDVNQLDESEVVAMHRIAEDVVREGEALSLGRHTFVSDIEELSLLGHADELRSAAMNLVSNAVRYTPDGGTITVRWKRSGMGSVFSVEDTGIGIEAKHIPRLTERFYRADKGRSRRTGGTGLGLAIVKHVLRRNGGTLTIESTPGVGSTFAMHFPEERTFSPLR